jgi:AcrR family transcriptional regulator
MPMERPATVEGVGSGARPSSAEPVRSTRRAKPLSAGALAEAALSLSQRVGIDGVTMKRVGEELGVSTMAAYRHVSTRQELLDLAAETVLNRVVAADPHNGSWGDRMRAILFALRAELRPYPWVAEFVASGVVLPERDWKAGAMLPLLLELGFDETEAMHLLGFMNAFLVGSLLDGRAEWGGRRPRRRPIDRRVVPDTDEQWDFGVEMLVTLVRTRLEAAGTSVRSRPSGRKSERATRSPG